MFYSEQVLLCLLQVNVMPLPYSGNIQLLSLGELSGGRPSETCSGVKLPQVPAVW